MILKFFVTQLLVKKDLELFQIDSNDLHVIDTSPDKEISDKKAANGLYGRH